MKPLNCDSIKQQVIPHFIHVPPPDPSLCPSEIILKVLMTDKKYSVD